MPESIEYFDSHCHFDFPAFDPDRKAMWQHCHALGVKQLVIPGVCPEQWNIAARIAGQSSGVYFAAGIHPWWIEKVFAGECNAQQIGNMAGKLATFVKQEKCVAIGECGLDAVIATNLSIQKELLDAHLQLASELALPVIIHCRKAHNDIILALKKFELPAGGVIHAFSGSIDLAMIYWRLGFRLGVGGTITYARAHKTRETVRQLPIAAMVLETDAPDMPLSGHQGHDNTPEKLPVIAQVLADLRTESVSYIAQQTTKNARNLFGLE
ncbi:MAG: TatD family hydrolase [Pseudomonadota bacterium]